ncbi:MAG: glycosyltransferase family 2 protein [Cyanobacteria bacterium J06632_22]
MTTLPSVAAVIPVRNRQALTLRFLTALSQQTYPNLTAFVVDSASTDGTPAAVRRDFPQVRVIEVCDRNYWTGATNHGVRAALTEGFEFILTINDDAVIPLDHIERLVGRATQYQLNILGNRIDYLSQPGLIWSLGTQINWNRPKMITLRYQDYRAEHLPPSVQAADILPVDTLPGNGVLIHRSVFEAIGLYNAGLLPHYHGDSELLLRARQAGFQSFVAPDVILLNDFSKAQKAVQLSSPGALYATFCRPKSHLYLPPLVYLFFRYCFTPVSLVWSGLQARSRPET